MKYTAGHTLYPGYLTSEKVPLYGLDKTKNVFDWIFLQVLFLTKNNCEGLCSACMFSLWESVHSGHIGTL